MAVPDRDETREGRGQADGELNFWIDGVEYGPWTNLWMRTTPELEITILWLSLFHHAEHSVEGIMFDDVVVSTTRIGPRDSETNVENVNWGALKARFR